MQANYRAGGVVSTALVCFVSASGCSHSAKVLRLEPTPARECRALGPLYGYTPDRPLEPPASAIAGSFFLGALRCGNTGAAPEVKFLGAMEAPDSYRSDTPAIVEGHPDPRLLDVWRVTCGDRRIWLYSNFYRRGPLCPPSGFGIAFEAADSRGVRFNGKQIPLTEQRFSSQQLVGMISWEGKKKIIFVNPALSDRRRHEVSEHLRGHLIVKAGLEVQ